MLRRRRVTVCFFGEGAVAEGAFHESLNLAALWRRAVVVDEGSGSLSAEISARIVEGASYDLDAPIERVCSVEVPIPYPRRLEEAALPQPASVVAAARRAAGRPG